MGLTQLELPAATRDVMGRWRPGEAQVPLSAWLLGAGIVTGKLVVTADSDVLEVPLVARAEVELGRHRAPRTAHRLLSR